MAMAMIYVFKEPHSWKSRAAESFPFNYSEKSELDQVLLLRISEPDVYHVTAFNTYGNLIGEIYKSKKTHGKES
jgi:hypothetical protein